MSDGALMLSRKLPRSYRFQQHFLVFALVVPLAILSDLTFIGSGLLFWPIFVWATVLSIHFFISSSMETDEAWVEERVFDLKTRSYDFDHIQNIEERVEKQDRSVVPPALRDKEDKKGKH